MTHKEKIAAFEKYKAKLTMIGKQELVDESFGIRGDRISIDLVTFAKMLGCPEELTIPDFVEQIVYSNMI